MTHTYLFPYTRFCCLLSVANIRNYFTKKERVKHKLHK